MGSGFSLQENLDFITQRGKHFIAALKSNRLLALSEQDHKARRFTRADELVIPEQGHVLGYLKGSDKPVLVVRQVFTHKDGSTATLHLVCSDLTSDDNAMTTTCKKQWAVEAFHKSLKSNARLSKSLTRAVRTQSHHVFMTICAAFKLETLSIKTCTHAFTLCRKRLNNASRAAYEQLQLLRGVDA